MLSLLKLVAVVVLAVMGAAFAIINDQPVALDLYFFMVDSIPLSLLLLLAMGVGILLGTVVSAYYFMQIKKENAQLRRKTRLVEQEVKNLRSTPINGH